MFATAFLRAAGFQSADAQPLTLPQRVKRQAHMLADGVARSLEELRQSLALESPEPLFWILRHLCANPRGYQVTGDWGSPAAMKFAKV